MEHYVYRNMPNKNKLPSKRTFPKSEKFPNDYSEDTVPFRELPIETVYHMYNVKEIKTKKGPAYIADFETIDEVKYTAWVPQSLLNKYDDLNVKECFVLNNGKKEYNGKHYFDVKLLTV